METSPGVQSRINASVARTERSATERSAAGGPAPLDRVEVCGARLHRIGLDDAARHLIAYGLARKAPGYVVTPNAQHVALLRRDPAFRAAYDDAMLVVADGVPLVWTARLLGTPLPGRVAGIDLLERICALGAPLGLRIFLLGGRPAAAKRAADLLAARHPGLRIAGVECPPLGFERDAAYSAALLDRVATSGAHVLFVALGSPKQELWLRANAMRHGVPVSIGVGGSFEFVCGMVPRAPRWMQRAGAEWLFRLIHEPRRLWRRYLFGNALFIRLAIAQVLRVRFGQARRSGADRAAAARSADQGPVPNPVLLEILGVRVHALTADALTQAVAKIIARGERAIVANHNLHSVYLYHRHEAMRRFYARAAYTFIEGMSLVAIGRLLGLPVARRHRIAVLDWVDPLMARAAEAGWRVFVLGGEPGTAERAAAELCRRHPGLRIATHHGYFDRRRGSRESAEIVARINAFRPALLLVGLGMPRQEAWIADHHDELQANVTLNVGGLMDCVAGVIPTAPRWLGPWGLEWAFRLLVTPRRTAYRYLIEPWALLPRLARGLLRRAGTEPRSPAREEP